MRVLLVHGLGRTPLSLMLLGHRLARAGAVGAGDPPVLLPVFHTFMMNSGAVERVIRERLGC